MCIRDSFQAVSFQGLDSRPPQWHGFWEHPEDGSAVISAWRLTVPELRFWLLTRNDGLLRVPDDVWETIAAKGSVDLGNGATYDVAAGLLVQLRGVEQDDLIPIELEDWIELAAPVNTDPLGGR